MREINPQGFPRRAGQQTATARFIWNEYTAVTNKHWRIRPGTNTQYVERRVSRLPA
jgi:hypothetical protein